MKRIKVFIVVLSLALNVFGGYAVCLKWFKSNPAVQRHVIKTYTRGLMATVEDRWGR